ncbi:MAG: hypothetical protein ACRC2X_03745, partial [Giesbergeria sp.]
AGHHFLLSRVLLATCSHSEAASPKATMANRGTRNSAAIKGKNPGPKCPALRVHAGRVTKYTISSVLTMVLKGTAVEGSVEGGG